MYCRFDFLLCDDLVRGTLTEALSGPAASAAGLSEESVLELLYVDSRPPPEPKSSADHDDWVGGVSAAVGGLVLTACYDGTVSIFDVGTGQKRLTIPGKVGLMSKNNKLNIFYNF